jgi:hypothetical protein
MMDRMILLLACFNNSPTPPATPPTPPSVPWPEPSVDGVAGWVGFSVSTEQNTFEEAPMLTDLAAYALPDGGAWRTVAGGTPLLAIHPGGQTPLTFTGIAQRPLGCDGMQQPLAQFTGGTMRPGPVWLLPPGSTDARALPVKAAEPTPDRRAWTVDGVELALVKTDSNTAELRLGEAVLKTINTAEAMDGAEVEPIDLTRWTVYADEVVAAWVLPEVGRVAMTRAPSFEGAHYDLILLDKKALIEDAASVYLCAF